MKTKVTVFVRFIFFKYLHGHLFFKYLHEYLDGYNERRVGPYPLKQFINQWVKGLSG
jgi:hypothetical protein